MLPYIYCSNKKMSFYLQNIPELPRNKLRVIEKLGEGGFGMVSKCIFILVNVLNRKANVFHVWYLVSLF